MTIRFSRPESTVSMPRAAALLLLAAFALGVSRPARAESTASNKAVAEALFDEGRKLLTAKDYAQACRKFEDSQRLDEGIGTLLYLGDCYEQMGRTASAWATFREAASKAHAASEAEREKLATRHATALEAKLAKLTLRVDSHDDIDGFELRRDGQKLDRALYTVSIPLDPGSHTLEASAPGKKSWKTSITVRAGETTSAAIPALEDGQSEPVAADPERTTAGVSVSSVVSETPSNGQRIAGYVLGGVGLVGLGVGSGFGLAAKKKNDTAESHCGAPHPAGTCDQQGVDAGSDVKSLAMISNIAFGVGAASLIGGTILILTAPSSRPRLGRLAVSPEVGSNGGSVVLMGVW